MLAALDSSAPTPYLVFGLILFLGFTLARNLTLKSGRAVTHTARRQQVHARVPSSKVVSIRPAARATSRSVPAKQRVSGYYAL
jgi:hypothetical protein